MIELWLHCWCSWPQTRYNEMNLYSTQTEHCGDQTPRIWKTWVLFCQCWSRYSIPFSCYNMKKVEGEWEAARRNGNDSFFGFCFCTDCRLQKMKYTIGASNWWFNVWVHLDCVLISLFKAKLHNHSLRFESFANWPPRVSILQYNHLRFFNWQNWPL